MRRHWRNLTHPRIIHLWSKPNQKIQQAPTAPEPPSAYSSPKVMPLTHFSSEDMGFVFSGINLQTRLGLMSHGVKLELLTVIVSAQYRRSVKMGTDVCNIKGFKRFGEQSDVCVYVFFLIQLGSDGFMCLWTSLPSGRHGNSSSSALKVCHFDYGALFSYCFIPKFKKETSHSHCRNLEGLIQSQTQRKWCRKSPGSSLVKL